MLSIRLAPAAALAGAVLLAGGCGDDTHLTPVTDFDAGIIECPAGQVARFGTCYCQNDVGCPTDHYCEVVTGTCKPRPVEPEPDAGVTVCTNGALRCAQAPKKAIETCQDGVWVDAEVCPAEGFCTAAATGYYCAVCTPGTQRCKGERAIEVCNEKGDQWIEQPCQDPETGPPARCVPEYGRCQLCTPNVQRCSEDGRSLETCQPDGLAWLKQYCPVTGQCSEESGAPACVEPFCTPGDRRCKEGSTTEIEICKADGTAYEAKDCRTFDQYSTPSATCRENACYDPCGQAARESSYQGCEYWAAVTTNSQLDGMFKGGANDGTQPTEVSEYAIVVSNPNATAVKVKVTRKAGSSEVVSPSSPSPDANGFITVQPGALQIIRLPWQAVSGTGLLPYAYHVVSDLPITAYQFNPVGAYVGSVPELNPLTGECTNCSYTNDGSLLIPAHILGAAYVVLGQEHITLTGPTNFPCSSNADCPGPGNQCIGSLVKTCKNRPAFPVPAFFAVVGVQDNTKVTIKFSAATVAARSGVPIAAQPKGSTKVYTLNKYDLLQFWTDVDGTAVQCVPSEVASQGYGDVCRYASDPTGTVVTSESLTTGEPAPVAVFSGADCTFKPFNRFACDHIEEMIVPFSSWGKSYAGIKSVPYKTANGAQVPNPSPDYWRVVAGCGTSSCPNGTRFTISPPPNAVIQPGICVNGTCTLPPMDSSRPTAPWVEFVHSGDFTIVSDQPVMLSQYFTGQSANPNADEGDPALILTPPIEQWRMDYNVLTSPTLKHNYLSLVTQSASANIRVNNRTLTTANFPGLQVGNIAGGYHVYRVPISSSQAGPQRITADAKVGVTVYGYDVYVSYGYTGGLDLMKITSINPGG
ncbi:MAG: IgGFc-binding protein [Myxococcales bacterium]|jgi:hypothetical protein